MQVAAYAALLAVGLLLAMFGAFLVPARVVGLPGVSVVIAVGGNLAAGLLGSRGMASRLGAVAPGAGWLTVALLAGIRRPEGDLVTPGQLEADPTVGAVASAFLLAGAVAAAIPVGLRPRTPPRDGWAG